MKNYYNDGYRNGHLDRLLEHYSIIAVTYPHYCLPYYAAGYYDGWHNLPKFIFEKEIKKS